jgi:hypothetical protein
MLLVRDASEIGLIFELNALWRVLRTRAELTGTLARLALIRAGRARPIEIVSLEALDESARERARDRERACERARKHARPPEPEPERVADVFAALEALRRG